MAGGLYSLGADKLLTGEIDWDDDDIKCVLVDTASYTVDLNAHEFLSDVGGQVAHSENLTDKAVTNGVVTSDDAIFLAVSGNQGEAIVVYKDTGVEANGPLIAYTDSAAGLPVTPSGGNIVVSWTGGVVFYLDFEGVDTLGGGYVAGNLYAPLYPSGSTRSVPDGTLHLVPYLVRSMSAFDRIICDVTSPGSGSTVIRLGLWKHNRATGLPGELIVDGGTVSGTGGGVKTATISETLPRGWIWIGAVGQSVSGSPVIRGFVGAMALVPALALGTGVATSLSTTGVTGALGTLVGATVSQATVGPMLQVRAA